MNYSHGQSILIDGGKINAKIRKQQFAYFTQPITKVIIEASVEEEELLRRLKKRDEDNPRARWVDFYQDIRKAEYGSVEDSEADYVLRYTQDNAEEIIAKLREIMK